jgi:hypothetical protein
MHGERPGHPFTHAPRQVGQELRDLVLVAADRDDVEPVPARLLVQPLGHGAVVPLGQLVGLVPRGVLPHARRVVGLAQLPAAQRSAALDHLVPVEVEEPGPAAVHDHHPAAVVLVQHGQQRPDPRRLVDHVPVPDRARQLDLLEQPAPGTREERHRLRVRPLLTDGLLDAGHVAAQREAGVPVQRGVLAVPAHLVQLPVHAARESTAVVGVEPGVQAQHR